MNHNAKILSAIHLAGLVKLSGLHVKKNHIFFADHVKCRWLFLIVGIDISIRRLVLRIVCIDYV